MIRNEDNLEDSVLPFLKHPLNEPRGQIQFCQNLIVNLFDKGDSPCTKELPHVKIRRQLLDPYLKSICSLTSQYGTYTIEIRSPNAFHDNYLIQIDDVDIEIFKKFYRIHKKYTTPKLTKSKLDIHKQCNFTYL